MRVKVCVKCVSSVSRGCQMCVQFGPHVCEKCPVCVKSAKCVKSVTSMSNVCLFVSNMFMGMCV